MIKSLTSCGLFPAVLLIVASSVIAPRAHGQSYRFRVPVMKLQAFIQPDASARLVYDVTFENQPAAHAIDVVDMGLPQRNYDLGNVFAALDGNQLTNIKKSTYIDVGVEIQLGRYSIPPGQTGTLHFECTMPDMVYGDTTDSAYASFQLRPTWFDPQSQIGTTDFQYAVHLLPGSTPEQIRFQDQRQRYSELVLFGDGDEKHVVAIWQSPQLTLSSRNPKFSVSFPRSGMNRVIKQTVIDLLIKWLDERPTVKWSSGVALLITFAVMFFRFSNGTGCVLLLLLGVPLTVAIIRSTGFQLIAWPILSGLFATNEYFLGKRKSSYLPAMATVEGGGIKRGLTAPQAAVLLELPLGKVVGLVIFGLLKKGVLSPVSSDPFTVEVDPDYTDAEARRRSAANQGVVVHDYEQAFIDALQSHRGPVENCDLSKAVGQLIQSTSQRMKGFDLTMTREYYQRIVQRAWTEAKSVGEVKQRTEAIDRNFEWMMMDPEWTVIFDGWGRDGYEYRPTWGRRLPRSPAGGGGGGWWGGPADSGGKPVPGSETSMGDIAASFTGWAETQSSKLADAVDPGGMGIEIPGGFVDLSSVDRVTADVFQALAESSSKGGGRGGGVAAPAPVRAAPVPARVLVGDDKL